MGGVGGVATGTYLLVELSFFQPSASIFETCFCLLHTRSRHGVESVDWGSTCTLALQYSSNTYRPRVADARKRTYIV